MKNLVKKLKIAIRGIEKYLLLCFACLLFWGVVYYPKWNNTATEATISYDVSGYYLYLPAVFIYKDLKQVKFLDPIISKYQPSLSGGQVFKDEQSGNMVLKYSIGQAIHFAPWFLIGHVASKLTSYPSDGFSYPYQLSLGIGMLLYAFIGLIFLGIVLKNYFSNFATGFTLLCIVFASNYLEYAGISGAMAHNTLFTNYCLLLYLSMCFYKEPKFRYAVGIGILIGLNILTRPTEIIGIIIPLLWGVNLLKIGSIKERFSLLARHAAKYFIAIVICIAIGSIQLIYWKYVSGHWFVYSYEDQGFSWLHPHLKSGILSFKTGWLMYSPIMILSLIGFYSLFRYKATFYSTLLFSTLFIYLCFAWDIWWYGGSLGQRAMVQAYPVLAFPMAAIISDFKPNKILKNLFIGFFVICSFYNFWLTHQAHKGAILKPGAMTKSYYFQSLLESEIVDQNNKLLDNDELFIGNRKSIKLIYDQTLDSNQVQKYRLQGEQEFTPIFKESIQEVKAQWIRCSADIAIGDKEWLDWAMTQMIVKYFFEGNEIKNKLIRVQRLMHPNERKEIYFDTKIPSTPTDSIGLYFWNAGKNKAVEISNIRIESFD